MDKLDSLFQIDWIIGSDMCAHHAIALNCMYITLRI